MTDSPRTLYLIDGHAQIFRAYHAIRSLSSPVTGEPTNATFGFVGMLLKLFREYGPDYVAMTLDVSGDKGTFRSRIDPQYKANRDAPPEDLAPQVERITELCNLMGIPVIGVEGFEADDVIATLCQRLGDRDDLQIRIVSKDKDLQQLLDERVAMFDIHTDTTFDLQTLRDEKGVTPQQVIEMLALMGDNVDNIPGVKGIGPKTAAKLIGQYGSIENLLEHLDDLSPKQRENIEAARDRLELNRELVTLKADVPMDFDLADAEVKELDAAALEPMFEQLGFSRHLRELRELTGSSRPEVEHSIQRIESETRDIQTQDSDAAPGLFDHIDATPKPTPSGLGSATADASHYSAITTQQQLDELIDTLRALPRGTMLSVDTETTSVDPMRAELCGISLSWQAEQGVYIPVRSPNPADHLDTAVVLDALRPILEDAAVPKMGQNLKYDWIVLRGAGVALNGIAFDTMIAAHLLDATRSSYKLDNLALAHLDYRMIPLSDLLGKGKKQITFDRVPVDQAVVYAAEDADIVVRLHEIFAPQLKRLGLAKLNDELETPLVEVLAELQYHGIAVDRTELAHQNDLLAGRVADLRRNIIDTAGAQFNPDSPKQLAEALFDTLGCKVIKRGKSGPSTDSSVLEKLAERESGPGARVAEMVLEYRQLTKLLGTYLKALDHAVLEETGRIHASFNQTQTATGRLSSSDPNLQNIPIRTDIGRQIRKAFIAPEGHVLLAADYSQIELRILAHLSGDPHLIDAFEQDLDIHRAVAAEVFDVYINDVTADQRGTAKMVNFGIVYGITPWGLARRLAAVTGQAEDVEAAKQIIADYKRRYPRIDRFLDRCVQQAQDKGYVETIRKRRRPVPQIHSRNANEFALGQRIAINTVVQGSAADLIKIAMVNLHRRIADEQRPLKMLLQIHDELVFEIPAEHAQAESAVVVEEMTGAMDLTVPLKVDVGTGGNWFDCK